MTYPPRLLVCVSAPATEPLTLAETKLFLRVEQTTDDTLITNLITAARMAAEEYLKRSLITQSWKLAFDDALQEGTVLPRGPVQSIASVISYDANNVATTVNPTAYRLSASQQCVELLSSITGTRVELTYIAGYGSAASNVPMPIRQGILTHIASMYDQRHEGVELPLSAVGLYYHYRQLSI